MSNTVVVLVDHVGRQFIGKMKDEVNNSITLIEPIKMMEVIDRAHNKVDLVFEPLMHTFFIGEVDIKWTTKFIANQALKEAYEEYLSKIKAMRQNISIHKTIPDNLPVPNVG